MNYETLECFIYSCTSTMKFVIMDLEIGSFGVVPVTMILGHLGNGLSFFYLDQEI